MYTIGTNLVDLKIRPLCLSLHSLLLATKFRTLGTSDLNHGRRSESRT